MLVNYADLLKILMLSFMVSPICLTVTTARVSKPFRDFIKSKSQWLGKLFSCPYCFSHWVSFATVVVFKPVPVSCGFSIYIDLAASAFMIVALSALISGFVYQAVSAITPME